MKKLAIMLCAAAVFGATAVFADGQERHPSHHESHWDDSRPWFPIGLSIIAPPMQLPSPDHTVFGAMVNLGYGQVDGVAILDVGLINNVTDAMIGFEVGPVNLAGVCVGVQAGVLNIADEMSGLQVGAVNYTGDLHGVQIGLLNMSASGGALFFPIFNLGF